MLLSKLTLLILCLACVSCATSELLADKVTCTENDVVIFQGEDCFFTMGNGITCEKPVRKQFTQSAGVACVAER